MTLNRKPRFINQHHMHFVGAKKRCYSIVSEELESSGIGEFGQLSVPTNEHELISVLECQGPKSWV